MLRCTVGDYNRVASTRVIYRYRAYRDIPCPGRGANEIFLPPGPDTPDKYIIRPMELNSPGAL